MSSNAGAPYCKTCGHCHYYVCSLSGRNFGEDRGLSNVTTYTEHDARTYRVLSGQVS